MSYHDQQDWGQVVLRKSGTKPKTQRQKEQAVRAGKLATEKKHGAGGNSVGGLSNAAKVEAEDSDFRQKEIGRDFKLALMQARMNKKMNQKQLATMINVPQKTVQEYENGKAVPNGAIISKLNRALGVRLPKIKKPKKSNNEE